jgi:hypothetical protein
MNKDEYEAFCKLLLTAIYPSELQTMNGSGGDKRTDSFFGSVNRQSIVFQFKFFPGRMDRSRWRQLKESLETAANNINDLEDIHFYY